MDTSTLHLSMWTCIETHMYMHTHTHRQINSNNGRYLMWHFHIDMNSVVLHSYVLSSWMDLVNDCRAWFWELQQKEGEKNSKLMAMQQQQRLNKLNASQISVCSLQTGWGKCWLLWFPTPHSGATNVFYSGFVAVAWSWEACCGNSALSTLCSNAWLADGLQQVTLWHRLVSQQKQLAQLWDTTVLNANKWGPRNPEVV